MNEQVTRAFKEVREAFSDNGYKNVDDELVGSTYYRGEGQDIDILVLTSGDIDSMSFDGWAYGGSEGLFGSTWMSWKKGTTNMLVTNKREYFSAWCTAAEVAKFLVLNGVTLRKGDVHGIHEIIMDDSTAEDEAKRRNY